MRVNNIGKRLIYKNLYIQRWYAFFRFKVLTTQKMRVPKHVARVRLCFIV